MNVRVCVEFSYNSVRLGSCTKRFAINCIGAMIIVIGILLVLSMFCDKTRSEDEKNTVPAGADKPAASINDTALVPKEIPAPVPLNYRGQVLPLVESAEKNSARKSSFTVDVVHQLKDNASCPAWEKVNETTSDSYVCLDANHWQIQVAGKAVSVKELRLKLITEADIERENRKIGNVQLSARAIMIRSDFRAPYSVFMEIMMDCCNPLVAIYRLEIAVRTQDDDGCFIYYELPLDKGMEAVKAEDMRHELELAISIDKKTGEPRYFFMMLEMKEKQTVDKIDSAMKHIKDGSAMQEARFGNSVSVAIRPLEDVPLQFVIDIASPCLRDKYKVEFRFLQSLPKRDK